MTNYTREELLNNVETMRRILIDAWDNEASNEMVFEAFKTDHKRYGELIHKRNCLSDLMDMCDAMEAKIKRTYPDRTN